MSVGERLAVGLVRGLHGLNGMVRVEMLTDRPEERFRRGAQIFREGSDDALTVASAQPAAPGWLVRFAEISDRSAAESLRDAYLEGVVEPGDELPRGEYYWHEVEGARVLDIEGRELGTVVDVYRAGGAEVFVVRGDAYGEFDLPAVRDFVRIFAPKRGEIVADVGALDLTAAEDRARRPRGRRSSRAQMPAPGGEARPEPQTESKPGPPAESTGQP